MLTISTLIEKLGGPAKVGRAVGATTEHITTMRRRKSIPVRYWPALIEAARASGFNLNEAELVRVNIAERAPALLQAAER